MPQQAWRGTVRQVETEQRNQNRMSRSAQVRPRTRAGPVSCPLLLKEKAGQHSGRFLRD